MDGQSRQAVRALIGYTFGAGLYASALAIGINFSLSIVFPMALFMALAFYAPRLGITIAGISIFWLLLWLTSVVIVLSQPRSDIPPKNFAVISAAILIVPYGLSMFWGVVCTSVFKRYARGSMAPIEDSTCTLCRDSLRGLPQPRCPACGTFNSLKPYNRG